MKTHVEYADRILQSPTGDVLSGVILDLLDEVKAEVDEHRNDIVLVTVWRQQLAKWKLICDRVNAANPKIGLNPLGLEEITRRRFPFLIEALGLQP